MRKAFDCAVVGFLLGHTLGLSWPLLWWSLAFMAVTILLDLVDASGERG